MGCGRLEELKGGGLHMCASDFSPPGYLEQASAVAIVLK